MSFSKIKTLIFYSDFYNNSGSVFSYYNDWYDAFAKSGDFELSPVNINDHSQAEEISRTINDYDLVVLLHSVVSDNLKYIGPFMNALQNRKNKLFSFVDNELNIEVEPLHVKIAFLKDIKADFIGTQLPLEAGNWLYEDCKTSKVVAVPHALNADVFKPLIPLEKRELDLGIRAGKYSCAIGDNDRNKLLEFFVPERFPDLVIDANIKTSGRFNRNEWAGFLNKCKGTAGVEAGSYYLERDDKTVFEIRDYIRGLKNNGKYSEISENSLAYKIAARLFPMRIKEVIKELLSNFGYKRASDLYLDIEFDEIYEKIFKNKSKCPFYSKAISSRHLDAAGTKTCQILFRGEYNGILEADKHYIAMEKDFSNISGVMERFKDFEYRKKMVDGTYELCLEKHLHKHRIETIRKEFESAD